MKKNLETVKAMVNAYINLDTTLMAADTTEERTNILSAQATIGKMIDSSHVTRVMADMLKDMEENSRGMVRVGGDLLNHHDVGDMIEALKVFKIDRFEIKMDSNTAPDFGLVINAGYAIDSVKSDDPSILYMRINPNYDKNNPEIILKKITYEIKKTELL